MKIVGPAQVKCKDNPSYNIEGSYNKTDASGDIQVELLNYKWELKAPESTIQKGGGEKQVQLDVKEDKTTSINLTVQVRFQFIEGGVGTFVCEEKLKIRVDCGVEDGDVGNPIPPLGATLSFWAEITGSPTGAAYPINGMDECLADDSSNSASTAIEVNDQTDIPSGTIVRVFMDTTGSCFYFEHCVCGGSGSGTGTGGFG